MKNKVEELYLAKCRYCVKEAKFNVNNLNDVKPGFYDYYSILQKNDDKFYNFYDKSERYILASDVANPTATYGYFLILDLEPLGKYVDLSYYTKLDRKSIYLIRDAIIKARNLKTEFNYVDNSLENGVKR